MNITYKMVIQYDGTRYKGWQRQSSTEMTIQGKLEAILSRLYERPIEINGSGRTDAGAHALFQVASFKASAQFDGTFIMRHLNRYLPEDIAVLSVSGINGNFHARFDAKEKTYRYRIWIADYSPVFEKQFVYRYSGTTLDVKRMIEGAQYLVGEHDFKSFTSEKTKKSTLRTLYSVDFHESSEEIVITYRGDGFLYNMVRIMTGTLMDVGKGEIEPSAIEALLLRKMRVDAGETVPACGLTLMNVKY